MTRSPDISRRRMLAATAGAAGAVLAGCVGGGEAGGSGELGDPAEHVEVDVMTIPRPDLEPTVVHIEPGGTVEWVGQGQRNVVAAYHPETHRHRRIPEGAEPFQSSRLREGDRFDVTFEQEGVYDYADPIAFCSTHEAVGVVGRVVVGWPDLDEEPAMRHDPEELPSRAATVMRQCNEECRDVLADD